MAEWNSMVCRKPMTRRVKAACYVYETRRIFRMITKKHVFCFLLWLSK